MPELPEVETVRRGLVPVLEGALIEAVEQRRPDLRFPFPERLADRLTGAKVLACGRRAKYLTFPLDRGETLIVHLGMTGRFTVTAAGHRATPGTYAHAASDAAVHEHVVLHASGGAAGPARIGFVDARRFGYWDLVESEDIGRSHHFAALGPEPLAPAWDGAALADAIAGKKTPIKAALLDQRIVAGLGNIYVCEALHRAGISPRRQARTLGAKRAERLAGAVKEVLADAIRAGGSTLRDYQDPGGERGAFQHSFSAYGREGETCSRCAAAPIARIVQSGRSTFFCSRCQR